MASLCAITWIDVGCTSCQWDNGDGVTCTSLSDTSDRDLHPPKQRDRIIFHEYKKGRGEYSRISLPRVYRGFTHGRTFKNAKVEGNHRPTSSSATKLR